MFEPVLPTDCFVFLMYDGSPGRLLLAPDANGDARLAPELFRACPGEGPLDPDKGYLVPIDGFLLEGVVTPLCRWSILLIVASSSPSSSLILVLSF